MRLMCVNTTRVRVYPTIFLLLSRSHHSRSAPQEVSEGDASVLRHAELMLDLRYRVLQVELFTHEHKVLSETHMTEQLITNSLP